MMLYDINGNYMPTPGAVNVKDFGAKGDGTADDYQAVQNALDSQSTTGGTVFFPTGTYLISQPLIVYSKQTVNLNGSTILQGAAINNLMRGYCTNSIGGYNGPHDIIIENGTFDGGDYTTNNTLLGFCHGKNITIRNCSFLNAYGKWHGIEINSSKYVLIDNCTFDGSRKTDSAGESIQFQCYANNNGWPWGDGAADSTPCYMCEVRSCHFYNSELTPAIGNHGGAEEFIKIHDCTFEDCAVNSRQVIDFDGASNVYAYDNTFEDCGTSFGNNVTGYNNLIDGTFTA